MENFKTRALDTLLRNDGHNLALLILRVAFGVLMLTHGIPKLMNFSTLVHQFDPIGLGGPLSLSLMIFAEVFCSCFIIVGFLTRLAAIPLIIGLFVAAFFGHGPEFTLAGSELPLAYMTVFLCLLFSGAGRFSVDAWLGSYRTSGR